jgi:hypothetical protein
MKKLFLAALLALSFTSAQAQVTVDRLTVTDPDTQVTSEAVLGPDGTLVVPFDLLPANPGTYLGSPDYPWSALFLSGGVYDGFGNQRMTYDTVENSPLRLSGNPVDNQVAAAVVVSASPALTNPLARVFEARNGSAPVFRVDIKGMPQIGVGNFTAPPTCVENVRGKIWFRKGAGDQADSLSVCVRNGGGSFFWFSIY